MKETIKQNRQLREEVEPVEVETYLNTDSITDAFVWAHPLPREVK